MEFRICSRCENFRDPLAESFWHWHNLLQCVVYHFVARNPRKSCATFCGTTQIYIYTYLCVYYYFLFSTVRDHFSLKAYRAYADSHLNQLIRGTQFDESVLLAKFWDSKYWNMEMDKWDNTGFQRNDWNVRCLPGASPNLPALEPWHRGAGACWTGKSELWLWHVTFSSGGTSASWEHKEAGREKAAIISLKILLACWKSGIEIWMVDPDLQCSASLLSVLIIDGFVCYIYLSSCASNPLLQSQKARALFKGRKLVGFGPFGGGQLWKCEILKDLEDLDAQYTFGTFGMEHGSMMVLQTRATSLKDFHGSLLFQIRARHEIVAGQVLREAEGELQEQARKIAPTLPTSTSCMKGVKRIKFPAVNFPMKHQEISGVFSQESDFPFHEGLQIRKSRNSLQNWGRQHVTSSFEATRFEDGAWSNILTVRRMRELES